MSTFSSSASYSFSSSSSSTNQNGESTGHQTSHQSVTDDRGNTYVKSVNQKLGEPAVESTRQFDSAGRELIGNGEGANASRRIEDVSDEQQAKNDREYEERMEEEYAKREGGA